MPELNPGDSTGEIVDQSCPSFPPLPAGGPTPALPRLGVNCDGRLSMRDTLIRSSATPSYAHPQVPLGDDK
jgi:hypothetical protein